MTEQSGSPEQGDKDQPARAADGSDRTGSARASSARASSARAGSGRVGSERAGSGRSGAGRPGSGPPGTDILNEFQRWLIRSSARNMRREIGGQVRKTFSGGRRESSDVWDAATTEIPPDIGEAPECQWCPICRAARQLRESGPGISGHISGAGNVVASAVQEAIGAFDAVLSKAAGTSDRDRQDRTRPGWQSETRPRSDAPAAASRTAERAAAPMDVTTSPIVVPGADSPETAEAAVPTGPAESAMLGSPASEPDAWSLVTDLADGGTDASDAGDIAPGEEERREEERREEEEDGRYEPDDRR
jgi:hypothetical protein